MSDASRLPVIGELLTSGFRLEVCCQHAQCGREDVFWTPEEAVAKLGADTTFVQARRMLTCSECKAAGREQQVACRASVEDFYAAQDEAKIARWAIEYGQEAADQLRKRLGR